MLSYNHTRSHASISALVLAVAILALLLACSPTSTLASTRPAVSSSHVQHKSKRKAKATRHARHKHSGRAAVAAWQRYHNYPGGWYKPTGGNSTPTAPKTTTPEAPKTTSPEPAPKTSEPTPKSSEPTPKTSEPTPKTSEPEPTGTGGGWEGFGNLIRPGAEWRPYAASSPFNIGTAGASVHPSSAQMVSRVLEWGAPGNVPLGVAETSEDYMHPVYFSQPGDPVYTLHATEAWGNNEINGMQIAIPAGARPAGGADGHMAVITAEGWEYDLWQVKSVPAGGGTLSFSWGGRLRVNGSGVGGGATAANFGLTAGIIRPQELEAEKINHALFIVLKCTSNTTEFGYGEHAHAAGNNNSSYVYPATSGGARCSGSEANVPPMGTWFTLAMTEAQINALNVPGWRKAILRAFANYGGFVGDTGGPGFALQFESGSSYTSLGQADPWVTFAKKHGLPGSGGRYTLNLSEGVEWSKYLRVMTPPAG
jgi:hypothetical protein